MTPSLLVTVDSELSNFPYGQGLWGKVGDESWGLARLIKVFDELEISATFFLDVYGGDDEQVKHQRMAAELVADSAHDLQLHTHPAPAFDRARQRLRDYTLGEQEEIIAFGCDRIEQWTGQRPILHRAGDWGADRRSLQALKAQGMRADFSACAWSSNCAIGSDLVSGNGWKRVGGLLCASGTGFRDRLTGRIRRVDLGGASFSEVTDILGRKIDPMILTLHSFSFLQYDRSRTRFSAYPGYVETLRLFLQLAIDHGYQSKTALACVNEMDSLASDALPWSDLPTTQAFASAAGLLKSARGRLLSYVT